MNAPRTLFGEPPQGTGQRPWRTLKGLIGGAKGYFLARLFAEQQRPLLVVTPDARQRDLLYADLCCFLQPSAAQKAPDCVYRFAPQPDAAPDSPEAQRQRALETLLPLWRLRSSAAAVVVTDVASLRYRVVPAAVLMPSLLTLKVGMLLSPQGLAAALVERGYRRVPLVEAVGEFALRGSIVDLFSPGQAFPLRLEFFGDELETMRAFAVASQTSVAPLHQALVAPMQPLLWQSPVSEEGWVRMQAALRRQGWPEAAVATARAYWQNQPPLAWPWGLELFFVEQLDSLFTYLPETGLLCCVDAEDVYATVRQLPPAADLRLGQQRIPRPPTHVIARETLTAQLQKRVDVVLHQYEQPLAPRPLTTLHSRGAPQFFGALARFIAQIRQWQAQGFCIVILCRFPLEVQRLHDLLAAYDLGSRALASCREVVAGDAREPGALLLGVGEISQGFVFPELRLVVLRQAEIFGEKKQRPLPERPHRRPLDVDHLRPGDRVVHVDYGIGRYCGMTFLKGEEARGEFMVLEYAEGAKLYVPAYRLNLVQKYIGSDGDRVPLARLGGTSWARTKARVRTSLLAMAAELVKLHAIRQTHPGYGFSPSTALHREFESLFEYAETEDQLRAIAEVMADMERPRPMERIVCGDVGYGKTEVAMRAAFKAVYDGKQVAVLVPTTVLAQQHYETFQRRFAPYPVTIEVLSRLRRRQEQQHVLAGLRSGLVDIVIGTHRLLQKDVHFKDLGLLVVDEEHRFGVAHKERIKRLSAHIDVLLLTATPIPRSLYMTMVGLRDFSLIETPPEGRTSIETIVTPFDAETIQRAIRQELARGGQVFFVHNAIDTLPAMERFLRRLVPECRIGVAHGQMRETALERTMVRFLTREFDLLLCTTIIESGLDIPSVNTILIDRAEQFGLAQLYQLRGRVGRRTQQAYAYLLVPGDTVLSHTARKRIEALEEFSALGASFRLATRDLEIRGAGNLLGPQQSGHIASVGFDLYCQMLAEAIRTARGEALPVRVEPELRLPVQGYIPETYVESEAQRLALYRRLAAATALATVQELRTELADRFGRLPEPVERLLDVVDIKILARQLALQRLEQRGSAVFLTFHGQTPVALERLLAWMHALGPPCRFRAEHTISVPLAAATPAAQLSELKNRLQQLLASVSMEKDRL